MRLDYGVLQANIYKHMVSGLGLLMANKSQGSKLFVTATVF